VLVLKQPLVLGNTGRLGGNGAVDGAVVNTSGTVAPGMSIGVLTIGGDYTHGADAVLVVETRAEADQADKVLVTGTATLTGGTVQVEPEDGVAAYRGQSFRYTILEARGGVDGRFESAATPAPLFLRPLLSYEDSPS